MMVAVTTTEMYVMRLPDSENVNVFHKTLHTSDYHPLYAYAHTATKTKRMMGEKYILHIYVCMVYNTNGI